MKTISASALAPAEMPSVTLPPAGNATDGTPAPANNPAPSAPISPPASVTLAELPDAAGTPFDPAKHIAKKHPTTGRWIPRGGRKARAAAPLPENPAPNAAPLKQDAPFIPKEVPPPPPEENPGKSTGAASGPQPAETPDNSEDAGECAAHALQFAAGIAFDAQADCDCPPAEHKRLAGAFASWFRANGWQTAGGVAVVIAVCAYFFRVLRRDKPAAKLKTWIHGARAETARNVTPTEKQPAPPSPAPAPKPAATPPAPAVNTLATFEVIE